MILKETTICTEPANPTVAIIGAGPAGLTAAIQLKRASWNPVIYESDCPGGLLRSAGCIDNYPGFPDGIAGPLLADRIVDHAHGLSVEITHATVTRLSFSENRFLLETASGIRRFDTLVVATGTIPRPLDFPVDAPAGVVVRDIRAIAPGSGRRIAIIGGGDAAFDYAIRLATHDTVVILHRSAQPRCLSRLLGIARRMPNLVVQPNISIDRIDSMDDGAVIRCIEGQRRFNLDAAVVLVATGRIPATGFIAIADADRFTLETACRLLFAGDVKNGILRQCSIAVGDGMQAAMQLTVKNHEWIRVE
ncbi:NAD(P)/FAD-dependent oxidoreductase [bacterium]|nr:NAD(P)/FAD-dependent oxidoreductase [candidate division CSSED10-310 bacterium]